MQRVRKHPQTKADFANYKRAGPMMTTAQRLGVAGKKKNLDINDRKKVTLEKTPSNSSDSKKNVGFK